MNNFMFQYSFTVYEAQGKTAFPT